VERSHHQSTVVAAGGTLVGSARKANFDLLD